MACVRDEHVTYASTSQELVPPIDYEDPSPLLTPEPLSDKEEPNNKNAPISVVIHSNNQVGLIQLSHIRFSRNNNILYILQKQKVTNKLHCLCS